MVLWMVAWMLLRS